MTKQTTGKETPSSIRDRESRHRLVKTIQAERANRKPVSQEDIRTWRDDNGKHNHDAEQR